jgi:hypothetical protein
MIRDLARARVRAGDRAAPALERGRDLDRGLALYFGLAVVHGLDLDLVRDLAVARLLQSNSRSLEITGAGIGLLEAWSSACRARSAKAVPGFRVYVAEGLAGCEHAQPQDDPLQALGRVHTEVEEPWVRELLGRAQEMIGPLLGSGDAAARDNLELAAALVLAAILEITWARPPGDGDSNAVAVLQGVLATLIALTVPEHKNQTLLLVKA